MFAKLYEDGDQQLLVMLAQHDDGATALRLVLQPDGLGVCHTDVIFEDSEEGDAAARRALFGMTCDAAKAWAKRFVDSVS